MGWRCSAKDWDPSFSSYHATCGRSRTSIACPSGRATSPPPRRRHKGSSARTKRPAKKTRCRNADTSVVRHPVATRCARRQRRRKHSHGAAARLAERPPRERRRSTQARLRRGSPKHSRRRSVRTTRVVFFRNLWGVVRHRKRFGPQRVRSAAVRDADGVGKADRT